MRKLENIAKKIVESHQTFEQDILNRYQLSPSDIESGVHCPQCSRFPMRYLRQKWICDHCEHKSVDAHIAALLDYKLLCKHHNHQYPS